MRILFSILFSLIMLSGFCSTITVGKGKDYSTVKRAVAAASPGDTIIVYPGVYREGNVIIQKSITLLGVDFPVMDGEKKYEIFTIHGSDITVGGFRFIDTGVASIHDLAAIKVLDSKAVRISGNRFEDTFFGIYFSNSTQSWIENNTLLAHGFNESQIGNGIHLWKCEQVTISGNTIQGHRDGIYFEFVTSSMIVDNHSENNVRYGLHFMFSHNDEYHRNKFINNGAGVAVMYTRNVKMIGNTFDRNWGSSAYGLLLKDIRDSEVLRNSFLGNTVGIHLEGVSRTNFTSNLFRENGYAIRLQASSDDNVFTQNNFTSNTFDMATNGMLVLNKIDGNYWDKYQGYDMNRDGTGDVPFRPVNMYAMIVERIPAAVLLWRSFLVMLIDRAEKTIPAVTPENLRDNSPSMKPYDLASTGK